MKTNFFSELSALIENFNLNLTIVKNHDEITVGIYPKSKIDIENTFPPLIITGTITELDELFFTKITNAMKKTGEIMTTINFYAKQMQAKAEQAKTKAIAKKNTPAAKPAPAKAASSLLDDTSEEEESEEPEESEEEETKEQASLFPTATKE